MTNDGNMLQNMTTNMKGLPLVRSWPTEVPE